MLAGMKVSNYRKQNILSLTAQNNDSSGSRLWGNTSGGCSIIYKQKISTWGTGVALAIQCEDFCAAVEI